MLPFFTHPFIAPAACHERERELNLAPLFRLLDDFESYHGANQQAQPRVRHTLNIRPRRTTPFSPKFDVRETAYTYELHGELPGLERENVNIEFVDPQTLVVRGRVERAYENKPQQPEETTVTPPAEATPAQNEAEAEPEVEVDWEDVKSTTSSTHSNYHHPTVEDDAEERDARSSAPSKTATPAPEHSEVEKAPEAAAPAPTPTPAKPASDRYWLHERSVGEFSRAFSFAQLVNQASVTATLENGVLSVSVPKAPKHVVRRVAVF